MGGKIGWDEYFYYDESSPSGLRWKVDRGGRMKAGDIAGSVNGKIPKNHWRVGLNSEHYLVHRIIWEINNGEITVDEVIDHIDGNPSNNRIGNLRVVARQGNMRNCKRRADNDSGTTGVSVSEQGGRTYWIAHWRDLNGKQKSKTFPALKYGDELAIFLACEYRQHQIDLLNLQGAGYTDRHGT